MEHGSAKKHRREKSWKSQFSYSKQGFKIFYSMQIVYQNENEGYISRRAGVMGFIVCVGRIGRHLERKYNGGPGK